jgi:hypothetical protein
MFYRHEFDRYNWGRQEGGWTIAIDPEKRLIGISICSPKDQFNKKLGRKIAEERAYSVVGDERMFIITAPVAAHGATAGLLKGALYNAIRFVTERYPNTEFGVQHV